MPQTYILKLARTGEGAEKALLLLESGVRVHTTAYARDKATVPNATSMKLRKHLNGKRATAVAQLGVDRIIDIAFGSGEAEHHLLLEMFAMGNVVLTDAAYRVLVALRVHKDGEKGTAVAPGLPYPVQSIRLYEPLGADAVRAAAAAANDKMALKRAPRCACLCVLSSAYCVPRGQHGGEAESSRGMCCCEQSSERAAAQTALRRSCRTARCSRSTASSARGCSPRGAPPLSRSRTAKSKR